eukprot:2325517-Karenia_brevis.AAC.1
MAQLVVVCHLSTVAEMAALELMALLAEMAALKLLASLAEMLALKLLASSVIGLSLVFADLSCATVVFGFCFSDAVIGFSGR